MKNKKSNNIRLGLFVSLGLFLLIAAIYYIGKKQQMFSNTFRISGIFKDISGLEVGNNVRFSGINIGVIENIEMIADTAVRVDLVLEEKCHPRRPARRGRAGKAARLPLQSQPRRDRRGAGRPVAGALPLRARPGRDRSRWQGRR